MKKILFAASLILTLSCNKDKQVLKKEDDVVQLYTDNQVIGKWVYESIKINGTTYPYPHNPVCKKDHFFFVNRPGQDHDYVEEVFNGSNCSGISTDMDWKLKGENLILNFGKIEFTYKILRLSSTNFDFSINMDFDGDGKKENVEFYSTKVDCTGEAYCQ